MTRSLICNLYHLFPNIIPSKEAINKPAPNVTHLLLKFDVDGPVERTLLQPKFHYSCWKVVLDILDNLSKPDGNALLHEFGFQLLCRLCVDPLTSGPVMDLLCTKKYRFFVKHLNSLGVAPLPRRNDSQALRISSLHQRAWLLKLLAVELHSADMVDPIHSEACQSILAELFELKHTDSSASQRDTRITTTGPIMKSTVLELIEIVHFESPDIKASQFVSNSRYATLADDILANSETSGRVVYYYSEREDRLIDLASFRNRLWQKCNLSNPQFSSFGADIELNEVREAIEQLLRWAWNYNKNLEEQGAQLHMLISWSQVAEVSASQKISFLQNQSEILFQLLDASLSASGSTDFSLKTALVLTQVGLTCMAKLRDERFVCPGGLNSGTITYLDIIMTKQLSNGACHSILFKLIMAMLRHDSSEALRRRQYALLLSYFQYCRHMLDSDVPSTILQLLSFDEQEDYGDLDLEKMNKSQSELAHANFAILRKEAQPILNLVTKDATQGTESVKTISLYVLDAFICVDQDTFFLNQLQSRGFLRTCFMNISNFSNQGGGYSLDSMQRVCTLEAKLSSLLRISHKYGKSGSQVLFSMGCLQHIASCKALNSQIKGNLRRIDARVGRNSSVDTDKQRMIIAPILRMVFSLTSLVHASEFFEVKNKVVREIIEFVKGHQLLFDQILQEDFSDANELTMEQVNLVVGILGKVWPYEESDEYGFTQGLFKMMRAIFSRNPESFTSLQLAGSEVQDSSVDYPASVGHQPPTLTSLVLLLGSLSTALERASEEKYLLLNKIKDINELSRQEVDEIINLYVPQTDSSSSENIQKRRYIAMVGVCRIVGQRNRLIMLLLLITQNLMNIILTHFQDRTKQGIPSNFFAD